MKHRLILDIGGTKTHIAEILPLENGDFKIIKEAKYPTQKVSGLDEIIFDFLPELDNIDAISMAVAGPVVNDKAKLTNVSWHIDLTELKKQTNIEAIFLLNDLEASAFGIPYMTAADRRIIYNGKPVIAGNAALIAPGTGLGEAGMYWDGTRYHLFATE